jgi:nitrite reductase/ring-hydroxylating ferredoxin subunit
MKSYGVAMETEITTNDATEVVAHLDRLAEGTLRMVRVGDHRVRTGEGVFALDNRCPHEGYGLTQGNLEGNTLTCAWHNWKSSG